MSRTPLRSDRALTQVEFDALPYTVIHLVDDKTRTRAICSGEPWEAPGGNGPVKFCEACRIVAARLGSQRGKP